MKKYIITLAMVVALLPMSALAAQFHGGESYSLNSGSPVDDDLYVGACDIFINDKVDGDLLASGCSIVVTGEVTEDVMVAGGSVDLLGVIGEDVRAAGGKVNIGNNVGGDLVVAGGLVHLLPDANISGDVIIYAGEIIVDGTIGGSVVTNGGAITINGNLAKGALVTASESFVVGSSASIVGELAYSAPEDTRISSDASLGKVIKETLSESAKRQFDEKDVKKKMAGFIAVVSLVRFLALLVAALAAVLLMQRTTRTIVESNVKTFGNDLLHGIIFLIVTPVVLLLLLISVLGSMLAGFGAVLYITMILAAKIIAGITLGAFLFKVFKKKSGHKDDVEVSWKSASVGIVVLTLIGMIPIIGWAIIFIVITAALGGVCKLIHQKLVVEKSSIAKS